MFVIDEKYFIYDEPTEFINDRFNISVNNKYGYIDKNGTLTIPIIYDYGTEFIGEHAIVKLNDVYFCIDKYGNKLDLFTHDEIAPIIKEYIDFPNLKPILYPLKNRESYDNSQKDNSKDIPDIKNNTGIEEKSYGEIKYKNGYSVIDNKIIFKGEGMNIIADDGFPLLARYNKFTEIEPLSGIDGRYFKIREKKDTKDLNPLQVVFDIAGNVEKYDEKYGVITNNGKLIIDCMYDNICFGYDHNFYLTKNHQHGLGVNNGLEKVFCIIPCEYENVVSLGVKDLYSVSQNGKYALLYVQDNRVGPKTFLKTDYIYDEIGMVCNIKHRVIPVKINDKMGIISENGYEILPVEYDIIYCFGKDGQKRFPRWRDMIMIPEVDFYSYISEEAIVICKNNKYGISSIDGTILIPCILDDAKPFKNGFASIKYNNKWAIVDNNLNYICMS